MGRAGRLDRHPGRRDAAGGKLTGAQTNESSAWLPSNAESTRVVEESERFTPADTFPAVIVYHRDGAPLTAADRAKAAADVPRLQAVTGDPEGSDPPRRLAVDVQGPIPAKDGTALETIVSVQVGNGGWDLLGPAVDDYRDIVQRGDPGLSAHVTGPAGYAGDFSNVFAGFDATLLFITAAIVIAILLITYRSPILWLAPLLCVGFALTAAQALIYLLAAHAGLTVNGQAAFILTVLVFGAAPTTRCCWSPATGRSCGGTATGTRRWRSPCTAPVPRSSRAGRRSRSACCACSSPSSTRPRAWAR